VNRSVSNCAHCDGEAVIVVIEDGDEWAIRCKDCRSEMRGVREDNPRFQYLDMLDSLVIDWNKRPEGKS